MRVRRIVTRSGKKFRGKFPSRKMKAMVHWESILENDAIHLFEFHPEITSYFEQPSEEFYYDSHGIQRSYFPDFLLVFRSGKEVVVEVKPQEKMEKPKYKEKYGAIAKRFAETGRPYRVLTEAEIRCEPLRTNLRTLKTYTKTIGMRPVDTALLAQIDEKQIWSFEQLCHLLGNEADVYQLIYVGRLRINLEEVIERSSIVHNQNLTQGVQLDPFRI